MNQDKGYPQFEPGDFDLILGLSPVMKEMVVFRVNSMLLDWALRSRRAGLLSWDEIDAHDLELRSRTPSPSGLEGHECPETVSRTLEALDGAIGYDNGGKKEGH